MKVGFSTFVLQGGRSGLSTYVTELVRALQQEDGENEYALLMNRRDADLLPVTSPNFTKVLSPPLIGSPLLNLAWHNTVPAFASKKYDLLHIPSARRIPLIGRVPVVATVHDLAAFSVDGKYGAARMLFNRRLVPAMIRRAERIIAVSQSTADDIIRHTGYPEERISVIHSGINHGLFRPVPKEEARDRLQMLHGLESPFFVYVSRLEHPGKNHIRLIEAFERFKLENDSAHQLVLAGADWPGADRIRARVAESPVRQDIILPGFVPAKSLPLLYSGCDLMVFPSLFEGFGFPIVEALACGAPVICSNTSSMREIAGALVPTFDPADSSAILTCMKTTLFRGWGDEARRRGMEYASGFDWRQTARRVIEVYRSVL